MWSAREVLDRVREQLPNFLDGSGVDGCARVASSLPPVASSFYLECRLDDDPQVDFLAHTRCKEVAPALQARFATEQRSRAWRQNVALLSEWNTISSELADAPCVWFEYDDGGHAAETPEASLSVGLQAQYYSHHLDREVQFDANAAQRLVNATLRHLLPHDEVTSATRAVGEVLSALPRGASIGYVSVMNARTVAMVKLYVIVPRRNVHEFLKGIRWPGSFLELEQQLMTYYGAFAETVCLDLSLSDRVEGRLGLATSQFQRRELGGTRRGLDWLVLPEQLNCKKAALSSWPGVTQCELRGQRVWIRRWLDTKAVITADDVRYKAYLGFMPLPAPFLPWTLHNHARDSSRTPTDR